MLVVVAVMSLLATLVILNLSEARKKARDSRRVSDVRIYAAALNLYKITHNSFFIVHPTLNCTLPADESDAGSRTNCVGAQGRGYGKIHLKSLPADPIVTTTGTPSRTYTNTSIADAIQTFIGTQAKDPLNKDAIGNNPNAQDYILVRCEVGASPVGGKQNFGTGGQAFGIIAKLESTTTVVEDDNTTSYCGAIPGLTYDFAAQDSEFSGPGVRIYGIGNLPPQTQLSVK